MIHKDLLYVSDITMLEIFLFKAKPYIYVIITNSHTVACWKIQICMLLCTLKEISKIFIYMHIVQI